MPDQNGNLPEKKKEREMALAEERRSILALPPEKALDGILNHPYPVTLVQSMAEEDLFMLVHSIGVDDALEVLGLASNQQWEYFLDMQTWAQDRVDTHAMTEWWNRLLKADPDRFTHWIVQEQREALDYYLFRNVELVVREYDQDPAEIGDGFNTEDDVHFTRMRPYADLDENHQQHQELRDQFLGDLLRRMSIYDYPLYLALLLESSTIIPGEAEEELLRLRNVRLAEKGFLPFEEAVGIYQPLKAADLAKRGRKAPELSGRPVESYPLRVDPADLPPDANHFLRTLAQIRDEFTLTRLQAEFAGLCNQLVSADQVAVRDKNTLAPVVAKVGHYISIGLEKAGREAGGDAPYHSANLMQNNLLADLFRVGFGCALDLKWRAERWRHRSWFSRSGLPLTFWGEVWLGVLGGLLIKKPLFFDNYAKGVLYREFETLADVEKTARVLDEIVAMDDLLSRMALEVGPVQSDTFVTCHNVLLTMWAAAYLRMDVPPVRPAVLSLDRFRQFFEELWVPGAKPRRIKDSMRAHFLSWLARRSGRPDYEIAERMGSTLEALFGMVEYELGEVEVQDLEAHFIHMFLLCD
ncbi:MAG: hypothetical protein C4519_24530 [Desulfobacteraceae bacterium]|nr:MAG: hypothetical protein C4519_24530 [Desulfobacteraceae bacterium]